MLVLFLHIEELRLTKEKLFRRRQGPHHQVAATLATEIIAGGKEIKVADAFGARLAVDNQGADEPVPDFTLITQRHLDGHRVVHDVRFVGMKPQYAITQTHAGGFFFRTLLYLVANARFSAPFVPSASPEHIGRTMQHADVVHLSQC